MAYRDAATLYKEERELIVGATDQLLESLGMPLSQTNREQADVLILALLIFRERNELTPDAWRAVGYLGNLLNSSGKMTRLMSQLWYNKDGSPNNEKPIDNAIDCITYLAFFIREFRRGNERGSNDPAVYGSEDGAKEDLDLSSPPPSFVPGPPNPPHIPNYNPVA